MRGVCLWDGLRVVRSIVGRRRAWLGGWLQRRVDLLNAGDRDRVLGCCRQSAFVPWALRGGGDFGIASLGLARENYRLPESHPKLQPGDRDLESLEIACVQ